MHPTCLDAFHDAEGCDKTGSTINKRKFFERKDEMMPLKSADALLEQDLATSKKSAKAIQGIQLHLENDAALMPPLHMEVLTESPLTNVDMEKKSTVIMMESEAKQFHLSSCCETNENGGDCHSPRWPIVFPSLSVQALFN